MVLFCRLAIVGVTELYINQKVERDKYIEDVGKLQSHVSRLNQRSVDHVELEYGSKTTSQLGMNPKMSHV